MNVENELGVIVEFARQMEARKLEILSIRSQFPDAIIRDRHADHEYRVEFEYLASNFRAHQHDPRLCDLIICWKCDCDTSILPVIALNQPDWEMITPNALTDEKEKKADYWRQRALLAEKKVQGIEAQLLRLREAVETADDLANAELYKRCDACGFDAYSPQAWAGHCKGARHRENIAPQMAPSAEVAV